MRRRSAIAARYHWRGIALRCVELAGSAGRHRQRRISSRSSAAIISPSSAIAPPATRCRAAATLSPAAAPSRRRSATSLAPNITPDPQTGIGAWTDEEFVNALTQRHGPRRHAALSGDALHLLHQDDARRRAGDPRLSQHGPAGAQSRSSPISCRSRSTSAPRCWCGTSSSSRRGHSRPIPNKSAEWNRGAYLVEGPGHCGMCHTPKNFLGGDESEPAPAGLRAAGLVRAEHHQ